MKKDLSELKKLVVELVQQGGAVSLSSDQSAVVNRMYQEVNENNSNTARFLPPAPVSTEPTYHFPANNQESFEVHEEVEESLSLEDREKDLIRKALEKHRGKRKHAASELGISERTLYRKIKEYKLMDL
jgi:transcriptional regulator with PAS, ATPase and Fis domain